MLSVPRKSPIFAGACIRNNYRLSVAQQQEMILAYRNTILNALKDVSNSLVPYQVTRGRRVELAAQVDSAADAVRLARSRYSCGNTRYLEVLTTDTDLYSAQLLLAQAQQEEAFPIVQLYVALSGGWR
jgi:multidrug efflux system outer membrane protein